MWKKRLFENQKVLFPFAVKEKIQFMKTKIILHEFETNADISKLCWSVTAILLSFFFLVQLAVVLSFGLGLKISPVIAPASLILSFILGYWLTFHEGLHSKLRVIIILIIPVIFILSLSLAYSFYDMSWDGLWYHQTAVYQMSHGWNPVYDPLHNFVPHLQDWLRYYAKGPWYIALALFETTNNIEIAKAAPWIAFAATFFAAFAISIDFGMKKRTAALISSLVSLNPVITCQLASYLVDGLLISFLFIFIAGMISWFKQPNLLSLMIAIMSAVSCINTKFTGLVYLCFFCAAGGIYVLIKRRELIWKYITIQSAAIILGILIFGFNPYVTNTIYRGNPFYPMLGTAAYPSLSARGQDPIERYETPHNMLGRNRFVRFAYAIFGRPGSQPFFEGENANLMWPFNVGWRDFNIFYFHEVRISGFGPFFSGALLIGLFLLGILLFRSDIPRLIYIILSVVIVLSLLISIHTWWARYGPQLWWLPILAVIAGLAVPNGRVIFWVTRVLAAILLINALLVAAVHLHWEAGATHTTNEQLAMLRQSGEVDIDFQYFGEPFGERLKNAGITFHPVRQLQCNDPLELMSVAHGYPGAVRVCINKKNHDD